MGFIKNPTRTVSYKNTVVLSADASNVQIGIPQFNSINDTLLVFINTTYIENNLDYTVNPNGISIDKVSGTWANGSTFNFVVVKTIPSNLFSPDGSLIQPKSITDIQLADGIKIGGLTNAKTSTHTDVVSAINERTLVEMFPSQSAIRLDGLTLGTFNVPKSNVILGTVTL